MLKLKSIVDVSPLTYKDFYHWVLGRKGHEEDECPFIYLVTQQILTEHLLCNRHWAVCKSRVNHQTCFHIRTYSPRGDIYTKLANTPTNKMMVKMQWGKPKRVLWRDKRGAHLVSSAQDKGVSEKPSLSICPRGNWVLRKKAEISLTSLSPVSIPAFQLLPNHV